MVEVVMVSNGCGGEGEDKMEAGRQQQQGQVLGLVLAALRKSVVLPCQMADADDPVGEAWGMEIGWSTDVRHVAHVTFDRLHGFLGLPVEFELEIPGQVPSARYGFLNSPLFSDECSVSSSIADASLNSIEQRERVRGVAGVNAVRSRPQGQLGAQDPPAHAREAVHAGWTQGAYFCTTDSLAAN
jgi:hypothetical protein